jgi:hypothetical protein
MQCSNPGNRYHIASYSDTTFIFTAYHYRDKQTPLLQLSLKRPYYNSKNNRKHTGFIQIPTFAKQDSRVSPSDLTADKLAALS